MDLKVMSTDRKLTTR